MSIISIIITFCIYTIEFLVIKSINMLEKKAAETDQMFDEIGLGAPLSVE